MKLSHKEKRIVEQSIDAGIRAVTARLEKEPERAEEHKKNRSDLEILRGEIDGELSLGTLIAISSVLLTEMMGLFHEMSGLEPTKEKCRLFSVRHMELDKVYFKVADAIRSNWHGK